MAGWILSFFEVLGLVGYLGAAIPALGISLWSWQALGSPPPHRHPFRDLCRRLRKQPSFAAWCLVALLVFIGALINPPSNYDGLTYRVPRLLYWLQEGHWYWIGGIDFRHDITGTGFEWMSAPFFVFTKSDRGLFLINFIPFLLLPGLFFVAARGLGIRPRVARWWMWVWPMAYGITMQAGSIGNDMVGAALALTSVAFAAQALRGRPFICLLFSALAAAAMTGIKATTLPLGLPIAIYWLWIAFKVLGARRTLVLAGIVTPIALLVSFFPMAALCWKHSGRWNGNPDDRYGFEPENPIAAVVGNAMDFGSGLLAGPIFPGGSALDARVLTAVSDTQWYLWIKKNYACYGFALFQELPTEEGSGIGLGISITAMAWLFKRTKNTRAGVGISQPLASWFIVGTGIAMLAYMAKSGIGGSCRLMVPFTPLLVLSFLAGISRKGVRCQSPHVLVSILPAIFLLPALCINPNRPLLTGSALMEIPGIPLSVKTRMARVYETYGRRGQILAPLRDQIPVSDTIGFAGGGDHSAVSLFRPFGTRKVVCFSPQTEASADWVVATREGLERRMSTSLETWEQRGLFTKVSEQVIVSRVSTGPETWFLYKRAAGN